MSLSGGGSGEGQGARDHDPISMLILLFMGITLLYWLGNASFSPWTSDIGCSAQNPPPTNCNEIIAGGFSNSFTTLNTAGFFTLFIPLGIVMFIFYLYREMTGEDVEEAVRVRMFSENRGAVRAELAQTGQLLRGLTARRKPKEDKEEKVQVQKVESEKDVIKRRFELAKKQMERERKEEESRK